MSSYSLNVSRHFLFNALNCAVSLCRKSPTDAATLLVALSDVLVYQTDRAMVDIHDELEMVTSYLTVQQYRFDEMLTVKMDVSQTVQMQVPPLAVYKIVENVFKHIRGRSKRSIRLNIALRKQQGRTELVVEDNAGIITQEAINCVEKMEGNTSLCQLKKTLAQNSGMTLQIHVKKDEKTTVVIASE